MLRFYQRVIGRVPAAFWSEADRADKVAFIIGLLLAVILLVLPELGQVHISRWWVVAVLGALVLNALLQANYLEYSEIELDRNTKVIRVGELESDLLPKLDLVFSEVDQSCSEPYEYDGGQWILYRVGIVNLSNQTIEGVKVTLRRIMPQGVTFLPAELRLMNRSPADAINGVSINKGTGPSVYADVVTRRLPGSENDPIHVQYADPERYRTSRPLALGIYGFTVRVEGRGVVQPQERIFTVRANGGGLEFYPADVPTNRA